MKRRTIKFGDAEFDERAKERFQKIVDSARNTEGCYVEEFEDGFAKKFGFEHAVMTSSGTTAGEVLWMAVAAQRGLQYRHHWGSVLTPALAFAATANCVQRGGLFPELIDIDRSLNMPWTTKVYDFNIQGVQFVLNMGRTKNLNLWQDGRISGFFLVVDACEGHGAELDGRKISELSDAAIYSFFPAHIMTVCGEGGMIATNSKEIANLCRSIKSHGRPAGKVDHDFERVGTNAKTTEFAAAAGISALENFDSNFATRRTIRGELIDALCEFPLNLYPDAPGELIAPHAFPLRVIDPALLAPLQNHLDTWGIEWKPLWGALSNHGAYKSFGVPKGTFPVAESVGDSGLHFGCHERMTEEDVNYIYEVFSMFFSDYKEAA